MGSTILTDISSTGLDAAKAAAINAALNKAKAVYEKSGARVEATTGKIQDTIDNFSIEITAPVKKTT